MASASLPPLPSRRLVEQAVAALRERILAGSFGADGELPTQGELCLELGVSRSVIREAMQRLQSQRLIRVSQGKKPRVLPASPDAIADSLHNLMQRSDASLLHLGEVRLSLESDIAALAAVRITPQQLERLEASVAAMQAADNVEAQVVADVQFHRLLAEATGNPLYVFLLDALAELLQATRQRTLRASGLEAAQVGHQAILAAIQARDAEAARLAMQEHLKASIVDLTREPKAAMNERGEA